MCQVKEIPNSISNPVLQARKNGTKDIFETTDRTQNTSCRLDKKSIYENFTQVGNCTVAV